MSKSTSRPSRKLNKSKQNRKVRRASLQAPRNAKPTPAPAPVHKHGFHQADWLAAKEEAKQAMIDVASAQGLIIYTELVKKISSITLDSQDLRLAFYSTKFREKRTESVTAC